MSYSPYSADHDYPSIIEKPRYAHIKSLSSHLKELVRVYGEEILSDPGITILLEKNTRCNNSKRTLETFETVIEEGLVDVLLDDDEWTTDLEREIDDVCYGDGLSKDTVLYLLHSVADAVGIPY